MSKTCFTIAEQKTNVINFIKKHKDILRMDGSKDITAEFIGELVKSNNAKFFSLVHKVRLKFGQNFYIFSDNCEEKRRMITIWLPSDLSKAASDKAIKEFCDSLSFEDAIEDCHCLWFNMTPKRWETFEAIFDFYDKPKTSSKKMTKKTAKKIAKKTTKKTTEKTAEMKRGDAVLLMNNIAFINFEAKKFEHLMSQGGSNIDVFIDSKSKCNAKNQIDHLINAFKLAKNEADSFIELLEIAKKNGAEHVVDASYTDPTVFNFTK